MSSLALGIMSGTSGDGVSLALARFSESAFKLLDCKTYTYPKSLTEKIVRPDRLSLAEISSLNFELGHIFAKSALKFLKDNRVAPGRVSVVGSHGQTLYHNPRGGSASTLQIGESAVIAEKTGITVVSNFRERDLAAGGVGAPLVPFFDRHFFGDGPAKSLLNIGGIANVTIVGKGIAPLAFDTGPGNCLIDWAVSAMTKGWKSQDLGGDLARKGKIDFNLVRRMARHPYFSRRPPKSTGREIFNEKFLPRELFRMLKFRPENALATLTCLTAVTIVESHLKFVLPRIPLREVIVSGGGAFNRTLMRGLAVLFEPIRVRPVGDLGIHPQAKEPLAFAFFALRAVRGKINHLPEGTGARGPRILGKITPGHGYRGVR